MHTGGRPGYSVRPLNNASIFFNLKKVLRASKMKTKTSDSIRVYLDSVGEKIDPSKIDEILNLPAQFRWYAANNLLNEHEKQVLEISGIRKSVPQKYNKEIVNIAKEEVRRMAYNNADFGRYRSTHYGCNSLPSMAKVRCSYGERYRRKYTSSDLYADYFFSVSEKNTFDFIYKIPCEDKLKKVSFFDLHNTKCTDKIFIYEDDLFRRLGFVFDRNELAVRYKKYEYHLQDYFLLNTPDKIREVVKKIILAFNQRKRFDKKELAFENLNMSQITVSIVDSIAAGNCERGTFDFANKYFKKELEENRPITAAMIWDKRKDTYTKMAIMKAAHI